MGIEQAIPDLQDAPELPIDYISVLLGAASETGSQVESQVATSLG